MRDTKSAAARQRGFNLVEVLIAMAITGVVIVSVSTLFYMGRQNVYSGKQMTTAISVATRITEDFQHMERSDVYTQFNLTGESLTSNTVNGITYANSIVRRTTTAKDIDPAQNDVGKYLATWYAKMNGNFNTPKITLIFMPRLTTTAPVTDTAATPKSTVLQIRAVLQWQEGLRKRTLTIDAVKTVRT